MELVQVTCTLCPRGCQLRVHPETYFVTGNQCPNGVDYGREELQRPLRTVTGTVGVESGRLRRLPVKTAEPVPKEQIPAVMEAIREIVVRPPIAVGEVIMANVAGTGINLVATRKLAAE